nr:Os03g0844500 [Ipomoea batatas]
MTRGYLLPEQITKGWVRKGAIEELIRNNLVHGFREMAAVPIDVLGRIVARGGPRRAAGGEDIEVAASNGEVDTERPIGLGVEVRRQERQRESLGDEIDDEAAVGVAGGFDTWVKKMGPVLEFVLPVSVMESPKAYSFLKILGAVVAEDG